MKKKQYVVVDGKTSYNYPYTKLGKQQSEAMQRSLKLFDDERKKNNVGYKNT